MESSNKKFLAILIFVMMFSFFIVYSTYVREQNIIAYFGSEPGIIKLYGDKSVFTKITIEGNSMYPSITTSNTIIAENITNFGINNIKIGDVIVFYRSEHLICHRVVEVHENYFNVKGDYNSINDPDAVPFSDVKYIVVAVLR